MDLAWLLSTSDLSELTGYIRPDAQIRWLKKNGWEFALSAYRHPKVSRAYAEKRLGMAEQNPEPANAEPDFSSWGGAS
jgi:hypothetical protein